VRGRVVLLSFTPTRLDPRVMRQVDALKERHEIVTCGYGSGVDGVEHIRIPDSVRPLPMNLPGVAALGLHMHKAAYACLPAGRWVRNELPSTDFDMILTNDLEPIPVALDVADSRPVVADLHEFYPELPYDWRWRYFLRPLWERICRKDLPRTAAQMTVAAGLATEFGQRYGVFPQVVTNAGPFRAPTPHNLGDPLRIVHHGMADRGRALELMVLGVGGVSGVELDMLLVPSPRQRSYITELEDLASRFENVRISSPVPKSELPAKLDEYDLGIAFHASESFSYVHSLPNKFFDFVQSGLPIIVGPSPEMAALANEYGLGLVIPDWKVESLRSELTHMSTKQVLQWQANVCSAAKDLSGEKSAQVIRDVVSDAFEGRTD
jgi:hypothetical protein